jgi:hypothetical protein
MKRTGLPFVHDGGDLFGAGFLFFGFCHVAEAVVVIFP